MRDYKFVYFHTQPVRLIILLSMMSILCANFNYRSLHNKNVIIHACMSMEVKVLKKIRQAHDMREKERERKRKSLHVSKEALFKTVIVHVCKNSDTHYW